MTPTAEELGQAVGFETSQQLAESLEKIEHCLGQLTDEQVWWRQAATQNSIGNIVLHLCGNVRQWIISGVGGETDSRDRPQEFAERGPIPKAKLLEVLDRTVQEATAALSAARAADLLGECRIQGFEVTGLRAILHSVSHFEGHTHQIVYITRSLLGDAYAFEWSPSTPEEGAPQ